jgi:hypothetical protein
VPQRSPDEEKSPDPMDNSELVEALTKTLSVRGIPISSGSDGRQLIQDFLDSLSGSGFEILPTRASPLPTKADLEEVTAQLNHGPLRLRELMSIWRDISARELAGPAEVYAKVGERILKA